MSREELFTDPEEVVTFAQAYYATEFPNDDRRGCPSPVNLRKAASSDAPPDKRLRSHLFACSDCFRSYRSARMNRQAQAVRWRAWLDAGVAGIRSPWVPVAAGAFGFIFLGLITAALLWHSRIDLPVVTVNYSPPGMPPAILQEAMGTEAASSVSEPDKARVPPDRGAAEKQTQRQPPLRVVYIDLIADDLSQGDNQTGAGRRVITLTPERQRLRLRMPQGSTVGRYTVKVFDAYGKPVLTTAGRFDGRVLTVDLDLRDLPAKSYRLCIAREGEAPDCYLMSVNDAPTAQ